MIECLDEVRLHPTHPRQVITAFSHKCGVVENPLKRALKLYYDVGRRGFDLSTWIKSPVARSAVPREEGPEIEGNISCLPICLWMTLKQ